MCMSLLQAVHPLLGGAAGCLQFDLSKGVGNEFNQKRGKFSAVYVPQQVKHNNKNDHKSKAAASPFPSGITGD